MFEFTLKLLAWVDQQWHAQQIEKDKTTRNLEVIKKDLEVIEKMISSQLLKNDKL